MISLIDIPPTLLDACGIAVPDSMEGNSIMPVLKRKDEDRLDYIFAEICDGEWMRRCVRTKCWKYSVKATTPINVNKGHADKYEEELYDLKADPWELNNVIGYQSHLGVSKVMRKRLTEHMAGIGEKSFEIKLAPFINSGQKTK